MNPVTDPALLDQLNAPALVPPASAPQSVGPRKPVSDPALLQQLEAAPAAPVAAQPKPVVPAAATARGAGLTGQGANTYIDEHSLVLPEGVDTSTGAPSHVRLVVGSGPDKDKLANIQQFYPDAVEVANKLGHPSGNFVYKDPTTGKPTLYNPQGLDTGDVPSVAREMYQTAGGALGGVVGAGESIPTAGVAAPVTVPVMAGVGTALGGDAFDAMMHFFGGQINTTTVPERLRNDVVDAGLGAIGSGGGAGAGYLTRSQTKEAADLALLGPGAANRMADLEAVGVTPNMGNVTNRKVTTGAQTMLGYTPSGADVIANAAERNAAEMSDAATAIARRYGGPEFNGATATKQSTGEVIQQGATGAAERFKARSDILYDNAYGMVDPNYPVELHNSAALLNEIRRDVNQAPNSLAGTSTGLDRVQDLFTDLRRNFGFMNFETLRRVRTEIGRELNDPVIAGSTGATNDVKERLYGTLTADLNAAAARNPAAQRAIAQADRYYRFNINQNMPTLQAVTKKGTTEEAFNYAVAQAADGGTRLRTLRRNLLPGEWDVAAGTVLGRMGRATAGNQGAAGTNFSVGTFLTNWNKMSPEAKDALFSGTRYAELRPELDQLTRAAESLKGMDKLANKSGTVRSMLYAQVGGSAVAALTAPTTIPVTALALAAPWAAAKLITSPRFVRWLVSETHVANNGPAAQIGRLFMLARANPELKSEIGEYAKTLQAQQNGGQQDQPNQAVPSPQ